VHAIVERRNTEACTLGEIGDPAQLVTGDAAGAGREPHVAQPVALLEHADVVALGRGRRGWWIPVGQGVA
jgi:hypothetical protein